MEAGYNLHQLGLQSLKILPPIFCVCADKANCVYRFRRRVDMRSMLRIDIEGEVYKGIVQRDKCIIQ